jgi:hypothetical protein
MLSSTRGSFVLLAIVCFAHHKGDWIVDEKTTELPQQQAKPSAQTQKTSGAEPDSDAEGIRRGAPSVWEGPNQCSSHMDF